MDKTKNIDINKYNINNPNHEPNQPQQISLLKQCMARITAKTLHDINVPDQANLKVKEHKALEKKQAEEKDPLQKNPSLQEKISCSFLQAEKRDRKKRDLKNPGFYTSARV